MATAWLPEYVELVGNQTLLLGSRAIWVDNPSGLLRAGASRGGNFVAYGTDGTTARDRERGELPVELRDVQVDGQWTQDNARHATPRANLLSLMETVSNFWDDHCTGRQLTVRLVTPTVTWEGAAQFEDMSEWETVGPDFAQTSILLTLNEGRMERAESGES